jgi:hypothetical protein
MRKTACLKLGICLYIFAVLFLTQNADAAKPSEAYQSWINCDYWDTIFDAAGYTDEMNWGNSPYHPHTYHELMSGEWAAAIYYDGIATGSKAMWLTDKFRVPTWYPNPNDFVIDTGAFLKDDPNNPVDGNDTGRSVIKNSQVKVTIDYEVVDLAGFGWWSPLTYREPNDANVSISRSERYIFLQTYTIKNIKTSGNITGLEFYQMLHSHGDDDYGPVVHCSYNDTDVNDPLKNYVPYNPVHTVGNFRYDITQWNNPDDPLASADHTDWVGNFPSKIKNYFLVLQFNK